MSSVHRLGMANIQSFKKHPSIDKKDMEETQNVNKQMNRWTMIQHNTTRLLKGV